jgi:diguanylate cyclase (GGDEF)-like protein/PAS domain S-box-containing protein
MLSGLSWLVADAVPSPVLVTDLAAGELVYANPACLQLWQLEPAATLPCVRKRMSEMAADPAALTGLWEPRRGAAEQLESHLLLRGGRTVRWLTRPLLSEGRRLELHTFEVQEPEPSAGFGAGSPDTLFRLTFEKAAVGMALVSDDLRFLRVNQSLCRMLGYEETELLSRSVWEILHPDHAALAEGWTRRLQAMEESLHAEVRCVRRGGETAWLGLSLSVVRDARDRPTYFIAMAEDITARKLEEAEQARRTEELRTMATTDPLTGLWNHRWMLEVLAQRLAEARDTGTPVSVLMLDLDHFRDLNTRFGHDAGDRALRNLAESMRHALRGGDVACRYGGEEFVMILSGASFEAGLAAGERVRLRVEASRPIGEQVSPVTCSVGVATCPDHASTVASLLKAADIALYQAKRAGRNRVCGYVPIRVEAPEKQLQRLGANLQGANLDAVRALVTAIDLRDRFTGAHCQRVARLSVELGRALGCEDALLEALNLGASLLDIGKIGLPDGVLTKPGTYTREEWELVRQHPVWGEQLVKHSGLPPEAVQVVRSHHERLDGSGYPDGLKGPEIPRLVRIASVADVACALRDDRPHRPAWPEERVKEFLKEQAGKALDPEVVEAYCAMPDPP